jgi:hypothetical protein
MNFRNFGFGALAGEDDLSNDLNQAFGQSTSGSRFETGVSNMVSGMIMTGLRPWLSRVFTRYPPMAFHQRMAAGFDFVQDLQTNHAVEFQRYIGAARGMAKRGVLRLNAQSLYQSVLGMMNKRGYQVNPSEAMRIYTNINQIVQMIYTNV